MGPIARLTVKVGDAVLYYEGEVQELPKHWRVFDRKLGVPVDVAKQQIIQIVWKSGNPLGGGRDV